MKRIQRKRTKDWRMPPTAKYVGRPTRFGNPFDWRGYADEAKARQWAVDDYRNWLAGSPASLWTFHRDWILEHLEDLRGYDLACWCRLSDACHVDVLIELLER